MSHALVMAATAAVLCYIALWVRVVVGLARRHEDGCRCDWCKFDLRGGTR